jgi:Fur family peroxide stress response transcriptional regulator
MTKNKSHRQGLDELAAVFKKRGLKLTHQRLEIFNMLMSMEDHPAAEDVYAAVKTKIPTISFDTVYRTLALFERHGVVGRVQYLDDRTRYDPNTGPHYHVVCKKCKKIVDFSWPDLDELRAPDEIEGWGAIEHKYLEFRGICRECLARGKGP